MSLSYSEEALRIANQNLNFILNEIKEDYLSTHNPDINRYGSRNMKLRDDLIGAIGYYLGYRIVENYDAINGPNSWKDIYKLKFKELLNKYKTFN